MTCINLRNFGAMPKPLLVGLLAIGMIAVSTLPALGQASGTWTITDSMNTARAGHTATLLISGQVLVAGGKNATGALASAEVYSEATGKWTATGSMSTVRWAYTATLLPNGQVLAAGGLVNISDTGIVTCTALAELYSPSSGQWTTTGSMTTPRYSHASTLLPNGQVLVAGGVDCSGNVLSSAELYDPSTSAWKATGSMNLARITHAALLQNGEVLMAGGNGNTAEIYSRGHWTLTSNMIFSHPSANAAALINGNALIFGGHLSSYASEFYNPSTNVWTSTHNIGVNPPNGPLTLLGSGRVLLAGGESSYGTSGIARLYDPPTNSWVFTGNLNHARTAHTATRLLNGRVLAAGGEVKNSDGTFTVLASAEFYTP